MNNLLREIATTVGFSVVATAREEFGTDGDDWLAADAVASLGEPSILAVPELQEDEVAILRRQAPELDELLAPDHPASELARNLYRLSRLLKTPAADTIRTEAALADSWWRSGDDIATEHLRAAKRLMANLADAAISGGDTIEAREDS